jgi:alanine racemase
VIAPPAWVEIDLAALRRNTARICARVGPDVRVYAVCKGDAYGCGLVPVARTALEAGADAIAVGNPQEAVDLREVGISAPILLYGSADGATTAQVARLGVTVTIFDLPGLAALASDGGAIEVFAKLDCGFGRLGFTAETWDEALRALAGSPTLKLTGVYTHLGAVDKPQILAQQMAVFDAMAARAEDRSAGPLLRMAASSRVMLQPQPYHLTAVNPGRLFYGLLDPPWDDLVETEPVIRAVKARVIQVKTIQPGQSLGYGPQEYRTNAISAAVLPVGFAGGLPRVFRDGWVLLHGQRAPIVGLASTEHLMVDVSSIPSVAVGDEAVLLGRQDGAEIYPPDLQAMTGLEPLELVTRLARSLPRVYSDDGAASVAPSFVERR